MKREGNFWVGENGNKWSCELYTKDRAKEMEKTMVDCMDCSDCCYCRGCRGCSDCSDCSDCSYCRNCSDCSDCCYCRGCSDCSDCSDCSYCRGCSYCCYCRGCRGCRGCSDCSDCRGFQENPQRIVGGRMGRRGDAPSVYWIEEGKEQCVVGCFRGTLEDLEKQVLETHGDGTKHREDYLNFINAVKLYQRSFRK